MKRIVTLMALVLSFGTQAGPGKPQAGTKTYHIIYVDNSRSQTMASLSLAMIERMEQTLDSIKQNPNAKLLFYLSNFKSPEVAKSHTSASRLVDQLTSGYKSTPDSRIDKSLLREQLFNDDLSNIGAIHFHLFLTESYARKDLFGSDPGYMLNGLLKEMAMAARVEPRDVRCEIYVPKAAGSLSVSLEKVRPGAVTPALPGSRDIVVSITAL